MLNLISLTLALASCTVAQPVGGVGTSVPLTVTVHYTSPTATTTATPTATAATQPPRSVVLLPYVFRTDPSLGPVAYRTMRMTGSIDHWDWEAGVAMAGLIYAYEATGDRKILNHVRKWTDDRLAEGISFSHTNHATPGWALAMLYAHVPKAEYRDALERSVRYLEHDAHRVDGGLAHNGEQLWDDTLMNSVPLLARYAVLFDRPAYLDMAADQVLIHARHLQDEHTGLWYHGWDAAAADPSRAHMSAAFWARGNAWVAVSTTELLALLPANHPKREAVRQALDRQLRALVGLQDRSGLWRTVVNWSGSYTETSGSAGIAAALLRATRAGWTRPDLASAGRIARAAVRGRVAADGTVTGVSAGTGVAPVVEMYNGISTADIQPYGQGLYLIMATADDK
jgi:unsaturated rhamnogalacturonyl hydrolase